MKPPFASGAMAVAGVVGAPVAQSLSPLIHAAWIAAAGLDAAYVPLAPSPGRFAALVQGLRYSGMRGVNVTAPFKAEALALADRADAAARAAGAANLLLFDGRGGVEARNTDGLGLLAAFASQTPDWRTDAAPVAVLGAGGAARGAVAALRAAGASVRVVNRTPARAQALADAFPGVEAFAADRLEATLAGCGAVVNATSAGWQDQTFAPAFGSLPPRAVAMDMVYTPLRTPFLAAAEAAGLRTVDGLAMLIGQGRPSFHAFFGVEPPAGVDVRALALAALEAREPR